MEGPFIACQMRGLRVMPEAWLERMRVHVDLKHGVKVHHMPTVVGFPPFLNMRTGLTTALCPSGCCHPCLFDRDGNAPRRTAKAQFESIFWCQHLIVMIDNAVPNGVTSTSTDLRFHVRRNLAEARMVGVRIASLSQTHEMKNLMWPFHFLM